MNESQATIVTHTFCCGDCWETTDVHVPEGTKVEPPKCDNCGSSNMTEE